MIDAGGVQLYAEQAGQGDDVIFISGLADEGACWVDQVAGLGDRWRITTFDNRGVGQSETPPGEYRIKDFAADTAALMDALGIERAHVVGSSMGGAIAQELDARASREGAQPRPERDVLPRRPLLPRGDPQLAVGGARSPTTCATS